MKLLICGTRKQGYRKIVWDVLDEALRKYGAELEIIEGCCPDSADDYAEQWAQLSGVKIQHFPSHSGNYLKRNIEMVHACDGIVAFWDGWSYSTCHTIGQAVLRDKRIRIVEI